MNATIEAREGGEVRVEEGQGRLVRVEAHTRYWKVWLADLNTPDQSIFGWADMHDEALAAILRVDQRPVTLQTPCRYRIEVARRDGVSPDIPFTDLDPSQRRRLLVFLEPFQGSVRRREQQAARGGLILRDTVAGTPHPPGQEPTYDGDSVIALRVGDRRAWSALLIHAVDTDDEALRDAVAREMAGDVRRAMVRLGHDLGSPIDDEEQQ